MHKKDKFKFGLDFQQLILQYTVTDNINGTKIIKLYDDTHFTLITHAVIASALKKFYKKRHRIPTETVLREHIRTFYQSNKIAANLSEQDRGSIDSIISTIYSKPIADGDEIMEGCINWARYVAFKNAMEDVDINDYESYKTQAEKLLKAQNVGREAEENAATYVVAGMKDRAHSRNEESNYFPTPIWQFNRLLNGNGLSIGNLVMLMSQAKRFKTGSMINIAKGYMKMRKKIVYFDLENGQMQLTTRAEQSIVGAEQKEVSDGLLDSKLSKLMRRYKRIGAELVIKRMPSGSTIIDFQRFIDDEHQKTGIIFNLAFVDYGDLMGSVSGALDETRKISDAFMDLKDFADKNKFEAIYTASHVKREASKRRGTKYEAEDVAKCIDKIRHCDVIIGLQESEDEMEQGVQRWEIIDQRNGMQNGNMMFWVDIAKQNLKEFSKAEMAKYREESGTTDPSEKGKKKDRKSDL